LSAFIIREARLKFKLHVELIICLTLIHFFKKLAEMFISTKIRLSFSDLCADSKKFIDLKEKACFRQR
jgi:hypothetical protein